jgi:hypothetical protein
MTEKHSGYLNTTPNVAAVLLPYCSIKKMARTSCSSTAAARQSLMLWLCSLIGSPPAVCKLKLGAISPAVQAHLMLMQMMLAPHYHHQQQKQQKHPGQQQAAVRQSLAAQGEASAG